MATTIPVTAASYMAIGSVVNITLGFAPPSGTSLTIIKNTGIGFIYGQFSNLAQGQRVELEYNGVRYPFVASYHGGTGNDLVLYWASRRVVGLSIAGRNQMRSPAGSSRARSATNRT